MTNYFEDYSDDDYYYDSTNNDEDNEFKVFNETHNIEGD